jgi:PAS domain S-box-containing protein
MYSSADQTINYVSSSYIKQLGYSEEDEIGRGASDIYAIIHPDDRDETFKQIYSAIENKAPQLTYSFRVKHAKGHYIWREDNAKFNYDDTGNYNGAYIICRDVTKRKQIEEALQLSETRLHNLFEYAPISIWEEDLSLVKNHFDELKNNGIQDFRTYFVNNREAIQKALSLINVIDVNQTTLKVFAVEKKVDILKDVPLQVNDFNYRVLQEEFIALAEGKTHFEGETQIITSNGVKKDLLLSLTVMPSYENSLSKVLISFIDISDRKNAEEALQKSEMFLRTFIDNSPFEIWARDINNVGILENKKVVDHFGTIIGKTPGDDTIHNKKIIQNWEKNNKRILNGEVIDEVIELVVNKKTQAYQQICFPVYNKLDIIAIAGFNINITERKLAEEALRKSQVQLKQFAAHLQDVREDEKKLLAREIHDELGQILVALKIDLGLLRQKVFKKLEGADDEDVVVKFNHLYGLVDDTIKTTRKIMTNLRPEVLDLLGFIDTVKQYCKEYQERHKVNCQLFCNITKIDINSQQAVALFRIVQESLTNVTKHAKATSVMIQLDTVDDKLVMEIADNGVGFDLTHKVRTDSYGMIGMKERVFLLEGELSIVSKVGEGTSVKVSIPYKEI